MHEHLGEPKYGFSFFINISDKNKILELEISF